MSRDRRIYGIATNDVKDEIYRRETIDGKEKIVWTCPYYRRWKNMLKRCYSESELMKNPTYIGCSVCSGWLLFSNFKEWMKSQDWEGKELDKDLLFEGNKTYSPETCVFISNIVNTFTNTEKKGISNGLVGASWDKLTLRYRSRCCNPFSGKYECIGRFDSEYEAHVAWKKRKHELSLALSESEYVTDDRVRDKLKTMYS